MATIYGSNYSNTLYGTSGADAIYGLGGNDSLKGAGGADHLDGGAGIDAALYSDSSVGVAVNLATGRGYGGTAEGDTLVSIENVFGSNYNDTLTGTSGANELRGGDGNDVLKGGGGADKLYGGAGDDMLHSDGVGDFIDGGTGNDDSVDFADAQNGVYVNLNMGRYNQGTHYVPVAPGTPDNIVGIENVYGSNTHDYIVGNNADNYLAGRGGIDTIFGRDGNDTIDGGAENDWIYGGSGDDFLIGGAGNDNFMFGDVGADGQVNIGNDTIIDFTDGDKIKISDDIFSGFDDLQDHMQQVGNDVVITYDDGNSITLKDTNIGSMNANDFLFY
jgi:Ca2+-binding RTX toxin-like protein